MANLWGRDLYAVIFGASFAFFAITFFAAWATSAYIFRRVWPRFMVQEKADWASRVNSQLHALVVVVGFLFTLGFSDYNHSTWYNEEGNSTVPSSVIMSISLGYFAFDFLVLVYYRVPLWVVFVFHHIVASVPYFTYLFHPCEAGNIVLSCFLLVEFATFFLNFQTWMEKLGHVRTRLFTLMFYCTYVAWFLTRVLLPVFLLYVVWKIFFNDVTQARGLQSCLIPGLVCSHLITLFCWVVFFFVLTPEVIQRWRETPEAVEARLQEAKKRRRHLLNEARANSPHAGSRPSSTVPGMRRPPSSLSVQGTNTPTNPTPEAEGSGRVSASGNALETSAVDFDVEQQRSTREPIDMSDDNSDDDIINPQRSNSATVVDAPLEGRDYELMMQTMLADNPYRTRPDHRRELRTMTLEELRREGISMDRRTTAYATTTIRL